MALYERKEAPLTPFTGAAENAGLGLFFSEGHYGSDNPDQEYPVIFLIITDPVVSYELDKRLGEVKTSDVTLEFAFVLGKRDLKDTTNTEVAIEVSLIDRTAAKGDNILCTAAAMVPVTVARVWATHIIEVKPPAIQIVIHNLQNGDSGLVKAGELGPKNHIYELTEDTMQVMTENYGRLEHMLEGPAASKIFREGMYHEEPMFLEVFKNEGSED